MRTRSEIGAMKRWIIDFDSLAEAVEWIKATPQARPYDMGASSARGIRGYDWDFNAGYEGALTLARDGWHDGTLALINASLAIPPILRANKYHYGMAGERPDVARYLGGDPENMVNHKRVSGKCPTISLFIGLGAGSSLRASHIMNYGAAICSVIDALENNGRRVEVYAGCATKALRDDHEQQTVAWRVKAAEDSLDLAALAFSVAHPAALRRICFALLERSPWRMTGGSGYGRGTYALKSDDLYEEDEHTIALMSAGALSDNDIGSPQAAMRYVVRAINQAAGEELVSVEE